MDKQALLLALEDQLVAAMLASDVGQLANLLSDDLVFVAPDGSIIGKADDISAHRSGRMKFSGLHITERRIAVFDNFAHVVARSKLEGRFDGGHFSASFVHTRIWQQVSGTWQVVAGHGSMVPPE